MGRNIGIITINGDNNYGNKLQNYATIKILNKYGCAKNIIKRDKCEYRSRLNIESRKIIKTALLLVNQILKKEYVFNRQINFMKFNNNIFTYKKMICKNIDYKKLNADFDCFVAGSDQVWNPRLYPNLYVNMLGFAEKNKKIAFAPSISVDELTLEQENMFKELLKDFDNLSCREEQGAELLRKITGKRVVSLIDPTLMLSSEEWDKISKKPKFHDENKKYLLLYFLGDLTDSYKQIVENIKSKYNLEVINILDKKSKYYSCGPSEFVYLIKNSQIVLTDSFHGSVFSYIYNKPFRIFYRQDGCGYMNSRLTNLMNKLCLDNSIYLNVGDSIDAILNTNYNKEKLIFEQKKYEEFLKEIFSNCKKEGSI